MNPHEVEMPLVRSTDGARAGVTGHGVRYVLGFSLGGAVVLAFLVLGIYLLGGG